MLVFGPSGAGKTKLVQRAVFTATALGQRVAWLDLDNMGLDELIVGFISLGSSHAHVHDDTLAYFRSDDWPNRDAMLAAVEAGDPEIVVVDSVSGAIAAAGIDSENDNAEVRWADRSRPLPAAAAASPDDHPRRQHRPADRPRSRRIRQAGRRRSGHRGHRREARRQAAAVRAGRGRSVAADVTQGPARLLPGRLGYGDREGRRHRRAPPELAHLGGALDVVVFPPLPASASAKVMEIISCAAEDAGGEITWATLTVMAAHSSV